MSVLRRAGVWLGLVEDDEGYEEPGQGDWDGSGRGRDRRRRYGDDYGDDDGVELSEARDDLDLPPPSRNRLTERAAQRRAERESVAERVGGGQRSAGAQRPGAGERVSLNRSAAPERVPGRGNVRPITRDSSVSYLTGANGAAGGPAAGHGGGHGALTHDNLALAPRVHAPEPVAVVAPEEERRYQITTLHPTTYREARTIGEHFREGTPVIMNLTEMDEADARRLVDFGAGLAFGLRGTMERVTNRVFLLSPANVQVTAEDKAKIAEGGFFHQR